MLAADAAEALGLPFHPAAAARACHDKFRAPVHSASRRSARPLLFRAPPATGRMPPRAPYPCVLKPLGLSASRGVIRADDAAEFVAAYARIRRMGEDRVQVESYIPGREFAVEGLVTNGAVCSRSPFSTSPIRWRARSSKRPST